MGPTEIVTRVTYTAKQSRGPLALVVTSGISLCSVIAILIAMAVSGLKSRPEFMLSQFRALFLSLVFSDLLQATGSLMNIKWVIIQGVSTGPFCTTQAALKQSGNVGTALWSLVIGVHTFCLLFLRQRIGSTLFYAILVAIWLFIVLIVAIGPLIIQSSSKGAFWGISGYWCWITGVYRVEQLTDEYLFMFLTAGTSFVLYSLIFFRLRGNIQGFGWNLRFCRVNKPWVEDDTDESQLSIMGRQMLWYPVAYTILILPIAICRWSSIFGHKVPYWATMTADSIFMLSGFVNAILYSTTRKIISFPRLLPLSHLIHIGTSRGHHAPNPPLNPYLDDIKFATPAPAHSGEILGTRQSSISSATIHELRQSRSDTFTVSTREYRISGRQVSKIERISEDSRPRNEPEEHGGIDYSLDTPLPDPPAYSIHTEPEQSSYPYPNPPFSEKRPVGPDVAEEGDSDIIKGNALESSAGKASMILGREEEVGDSQAITRNQSENSVTTDGAPSVHHKRFSGWSFPSIRDPPSQVSSAGEESVRTELEEMQFAPPSPDHAYGKLSLRRSSNEFQSPNLPLGNDYVE